ncbi:Type III secretion injected virulence protein (YopP,YopJ) [Pseudomonas synxantha]|uniref:Type III secretion injected virulence protein (YopP,YopJ) n=1 Tax=Pseudomonas synxantha TaxID=47883 RepID=A0A3G7UC23_9PSED|nr:YopJ/AvrA family T3SS effector serine/threonine acetyltransferase [Pseudomonas synxantha]AZE56934.1 Type III secretion injected virulence protein (YopP,YopJ) [Pseudomonas synxantha]
MIGPISKTNSLGDSSKKETSSFISNEKLISIITQLEADIADGSWPRKNYSTMDLKIMPALVMQANSKFPEMNLNFVKSPKDLCIELKNAIEHGVESSRFIINMGEDGIHFSALDYKRINGKTSLILFEPANFRGLGPGLLGVRTKMAIEQYQLPDCHFSMVEMDIQRSSSGCGIFSLALAKKLYIERDSLLKIHEENIQGTLSDGEMPLHHDKTDPYLPVTFYKHTQGKRRLNEYLNANPQGVNTVINKKNETILTRLANNQSVINGKELSVSVHKKRIAEYNALLKS